MKLSRDWILKLRRELRFRLSVTLPLSHFRLFWGLLLGPSFTSLPLLILQEWGHETLVLKAGETDLILESSIPYSLVSQASYPTSVNPPFPYLWSKKATSTVWGV